MADSIRLRHDKFPWVERQIFTRRFVPDCMAHHCRHDGRPHLDACCQYGADVDLFQRDAILAEADRIAPLLHPDVPRDAWFDAASRWEDETWPSGAAVRTGRNDRGCVLLRRDGRGCALHELRLKPQICRLYPITWDDEGLYLVEEFAEYSCGDFAGGPTVYRLMRSILASEFGPELVQAMDEAEQAVRSSTDGTHSRRDASAVASPPFESR